jgi:hypothetical protein
MAWEIFIENVKVDAPEDLSAQLSYSIDDIRDFATRNTNFSKTIVLAGTATNKKVFGHIFDAGSSNFSDPAAANVNYDFSAARVARALIFADGLQVFKGVIRLMDIVVDGANIEFETAVFGELGGLIAKFADKRLTDLDFSDYNHEFNITNVVNSWSAPLGSGYYYPFIDYGYSQDKVSWPIETFRPALYAREYVDKILKGAGYTYDSLFMALDYFKKLIVTYNDAFPAIEVSEVLHITGGGYTNIPDTSPTDPMGFSTVVGTPYFFINGLTNQFTWTRSETTTLSISLGCIWSYSGSVDAGIVLISVWKNGVSEFVQGVDTGSATSGSVNFTCSIDVSQGDFIEFKPYKRLESNDVDISSCEVSITGTPNVRIPITVGDTISMNSLIPKNIFQKDFFASIVKAFNLYVYEDPNQYNHLVITPHFQFYQTNAESFENWDGKLDRSKAYRYTPMAELNSRIYEFKYKDDSDFYNQLYKDKFNETYGSIAYDTAVEGVKDKNTVELIFSPTPLVEYSTSDKVMSAIYKKNSDGTFERTAHNMRLLFRSLEAIPCQEYEVSWINPSTAGTETTTLDTYGYAGHLDDPDAPNEDLNFGSPKEFYFTILIGALSNNLFNVFWSFYIGEIADKDSKLLVGYFKLSQLDLLNLDFTRVKYINGLLWRLNKIIDYNPNGTETTKCELLKVIDLIPAIIEG